MDRAPDHPKTWLIAGLVLLCISVVTWRPLFPGPVVDFIDVGHGDATFIRTPAGETLLVDGGDRSPYMDYGSAVVVPFLLSHGVTYLDYVIITHFDRDHMGGLFYVLERIRVGEVLLPWYQEGKQLENEFITHCTALKIPLRRIAIGDEVPLIGASMDVLHPPKTGWESKSSNEQSLVFMLQWCGLNIVLPGDAESEAEARVAQQVDRADILKAGHHGSHTSSSALFIDAIQPRYAIVSTRGSARRQGVHPEVRRRFDERDIPLWRTDFHGGIRLQPLGSEYQLHGARHARGYSLDPAWYNRASLSDDAVVGIGQ